MTREDGVDGWPTFTLTPAEFERTVADLVRAAGHEVTDWQVEHLDPVEGVDGTFIIDVTVRFRFLGADFVVLFECKRHASPVKREHVQVLNDKLRSTGAHKGVMVAASGFQSGALEYAAINKIACVRLVDGAWTYEIRDLTPTTPQPSGHYVPYARQPTRSGQHNDILLNQQSDYQKLLFEGHQGAG